MQGTRLSRFRVSDPSVPIIDPTSEIVYAGWNSEGHSGGSLHFGHDGYLYVTVGDGQNPNPPDRLEMGQDISDLEGSVLRIDVDRRSGDLPYSIPADNPFVGRENARGEIWAFEFRNPWKMAFDPKTDSLWTGDVDWKMMEMVYRVERGGNYGWSVMEGSQVVKKDAYRDDVSITPPVVEHSHLEARSVTGGYFRQSDRLPELQVAYLYGDWMTGKIWAVKHDGEQVTWHEELADSNLQIICFALDDDGEVYMVGYDGSVHQLLPNEQSSASEDFPRKLSETGLFRSVVTQEPSPGVIPYEINDPHWSDFTTSEQWIAIPGLERLGVFDKSDWKTGQVEGHFIFPHDTVLAKTVSYLRNVDDPKSTTRLETSCCIATAMIGMRTTTFGTAINQRRSCKTMLRPIVSLRFLILASPVVRVSKSGTMPAETNVRCATFGVRARFTGSNGISSIARRICIMATSSIALNRWGCFRMRYNVESRSHRLTMKQITRAAGTKLLAHELRPLSPTRRWGDGGVRVGRKQGSG